MEEQNFNKIINIYNDFIKNLNDNINNKKISLFTHQSEDCYLIEEQWINELIKCFNKYNNNNLNKKIFLQKSSPIFINNFEDIIYNINNSKKLKLVNKKLIDSLLNKNNENILRDLSIIIYYGGNNKIILEYKNKKDNKALLLMNQLNENIMKNKSFIIDIDNKYKLSLYKDILSEKDNLHIFIKNNYKNYIIPFEQYLKSNYNNISSKIENKKSLSPLELNNSLNNENENIFAFKEQNDINEDKESFKREILKILIYIFYYEKYISDYGVKIFFEKQIYYLIDKEWLDKYLKYYEYPKSYQSLLNISKQNTKINYNNLNEYIQKICLNKNIINLEKEKFKDSIIFSKIIKTNNNLFFNNCYIFPYIIIELMNKNIFKNIDISNDQKTIFVKNNNIYFTDDNNIIFGNLNINIFTPKYILSYNTKEILNSENGILSNNTIEEYLQKRNCKNDDINQKDLIDQNKKIIGKLITLIDEKNHINNSHIQNTQSMSNFNKIPIEKKLSNKRNLINMKPAPINTYDISPKNFNCSLSNNVNNTYQHLFKNKINIRKNQSKNNNIKNIINNSKAPNLRTRNNSNKKIINKEENNNILNDNTINTEKKYNKIINNSTNEEIKLNKEIKLIDIDDNNRKNNGNIIYKKNEAKISEKIEKGIEIQNLINELEKLKKNNKNKDEQIINKDKELKEKENQIIKINKENENLKNEINIIKREIDEYKEIIIEKDNEINQLKKENKEEKEKNEKKDNIIKKNQIINWELKYLDIKNDLENKERELKKQINIINELNLKIKEKEKENEILKIKYNLNIQNNLEIESEEQKNEFETKINENTQTNTEFTNKIISYKFKEYQEQLINKYKEKEKNENKPKEENNIKQNINITTDNQLHNPIYNIYCFKNDNNKYQTRNPISNIYDPKLGIYKMEKKNYNNYNIINMPENYE